MAEVSKLRVYSLGVVAVNKPLNSRICEICAMEDSPMVDGELTDNAVTVDTPSQDATGTPYSVTNTLTTTVKATWLPHGSSNRMTAPDVRRGENVVLYRFADSDKFWWTTLHDDMNLRKLETVIYAFSGTQDEGADTDGSNSYFMEISTHQGLVTFHTSKANGELCEYDVQINAKTGFVQIQDDKGNIFCLTSATNQLQMINADGSYVNIFGPNITINGAASIALTAPNITATILNVAQSVTAPTFNGALSGNANTASSLL